MTRHRLFCKADSATVLHALYYIENELSKRYLLSVDVVLPHELLLSFHDEQG